MYYVGFSSATIVASLILFQGFNTTDGTNTLSLLCGFIVTFLGVHLLNLSRKPDGEHHSSLESGIIQPRLSLQGRMSIDGWNGVAGTPLGAHHRQGRQNGIGPPHGAVIFDQDEVDGMALSELPEADEDDSDDADERTRLRNPQDTRRIRSRSHSNSPSTLSQAGRRLQ
jgi:magnesium transporter